MREVLKQDEKLILDTIEMVKLFQGLQNEQREAVILFMKINAKQKKANLYLISDYQ